jgi:hypothetical protein
METASDINRGPEIKPGYTPGIREAGYDIPEYGCAPDSRAAYTSVCLDPP